jgi:hypothetical protein
MMHPKDQPTHDIQPLQRERGGASPQVNRRNADGGVASATPTLAR